MYAGVPTIAPPSVGITTNYAQPGAVNSWQAPALPSVPLPAQENLARSVQDTTRHVPVEGSAATSREAGKGASQSSSAPSSQTPTAAHMNSANRRRMKQRERRKNRGMVPSDNADLEKNVDVVDAEGPASAGDKVSTSSIAQASLAQTVADVMPATWDYRTVPVHADSTSTTPPATAKPSMPLPIFVPSTTSTASAAAFRSDDIEQDLSESLFRFTVDSSCGHSQDAEPGKSIIAISKQDTSHVERPEHVVSAATLGKVANTRSTIAARAAAGIRSSITEDKALAWQNLQQEFEVQQLIWNSTPSRTASGNWVMISDASKRPEAAVIQAIKHSLEVSRTDKAAASTLLAQEVSRDAATTMHLNNAMRSATENIVKSEQVAPIRLRLAEFLDVIGTNPTAAAQDPQCAEKELEALVNSCDLGTHKVVPLVRLALGLSTLEEQSEASQPSPSAPSQARGKASRMPRGGSAHVPIIRSGRSSSSSGSESYRRRRRHSRRRNSRHRRSQSSSPSRSSNRSSWSETSISSLHSLTSIREGKVMRL